MRALRRSKMKNTKYDKETEAVGYSNQVKCSSSEPANQIEALQMENEKLQYGIKALESELLNTFRKLSNWI